MTFDLLKIAQLQTELTVTWHQIEPAATGEGLFRLVQENHFFNFQLWHEEDIARRDDLGFERIYQAKRAIDGYNQQRNNFAEAMDKALVAALEPAESGCPKNSETPGMMIDRMSILALKEFHMREETQRQDVDEAHRNQCAEKLARILLQRADLTQCLIELVDAVQARSRTFAVYYQFKMYNDPSLNPQLYAAAK